MSDPPFVLAPSASMGINWRPAKNFLWLDSFTMIYPCGRHFVLHDVLARKQRFLTCDSHSSTDASRSPFAVHLHRKLLAICGAIRAATSMDVVIVDVNEFHLKCPVDTSRVSKTDESNGEDSLNLASIITGIQAVHQAKTHAPVSACTKHMLDLNTLGQQLGRVNAVVSLDFASDGRSILIQLGEPSWQAVRWEFAGAGGVLSPALPPSPTAVHCALHNPFDRQLLAFLSSESLRMADVSGVAVHSSYPLSRIADDFSCLAFVRSDVLVVGAASGCVYLIFRGLLAQTLKLDAAVRSMVVRRNCIIVAIDGGVVTLSYQDAGESAHATPAVAPQTSSTSAVAKVHVSSADNRRFDTDSDSDSDADPKGKKSTKSILPPSQIVMRSTPQKAKTTVHAIQSTPRPLVDNPPSTSRSAAQLQNSAHAKGILTQVGASLSIRPSHARIAAPLMPELKRFHQKNSLTETSVESFLLSSPSAGAPTSADQAFERVPCESDDIVDASDSDMQIMVPSHIDIDQTSGRIAVGFDQAHVLIAIAPTDSPPLEDSLFALTAEWHSRPISGVDTSDEHALLMTFSCEESQIHLRNLYSNTLLLRHRVTGGSLLSACLHPNGSLVAVGLSTCLRVFNFLDFERKLSLWVQLPLTSCISMRFSHRGQLLAATDGRFVSIIDIATMSRSTYFRPPGMSSSAENSGGVDAGNAVSSSTLSFIRQLQWSEDDLTLLVSNGFSAGIFSIVDRRWIAEQSVPRDSELVGSLIAPATAARSTLHAQHAPARTWQQRTVNEVEATDSSALVLMSTPRRDVPSSGRDLPSPKADVSVSNSSAFGRLLLFNVPALQTAHHTATAALVNLNASLTFNDPIHQLSLAAPLISNVTSYVCTQTHTLVFFGGPTGCIVAAASDSVFSAKNAVSGLISRAIGKRGLSRGADQRADAMWEYAAHLAAMTSLHVSGFHRSIISVAADGTVFVSKLVDPRTHAQPMFLEPTSFKVRDTDDDLVLSRRRLLVDQQERIEALVLEMRIMKANFEVHHVESAKSASRSMSDLERHWRDVVAQQSRKFSEAESAHSEVERQLRSQIASFRGFHGNAVLEVEQQYERRLSDLREEFARLSQKMNADMTANDNRVFLLEEQLDFERNQARANVSEREQELRRTVKQLTEELQQVKLLSKSAQRSQEDVDLFQRNRDYSTRRENLYAMRSIQLDEEISRTNEKLRTSEATANELETELNSRARDFERMKFEHTQMVEQLAAMSREKALAVNDATALSKKDELMRLQYDQLRQTLFAATEKLNMPSLSVDDRLNAAQELLNSSGLEAEFQRFIRDRKETESSKREKDQLISALRRDTEALRGEIVARERIIQQGKRDISALVSMAQNTPLLQNIRQLQSAFNTVRPTNAVAEEEISHALLSHSTSVKLARKQTASAASDELQAARTQISELIDKVRVLQLKCDELPTAAPTTGISYKCASCAKVEALADDHIPIRIPHALETADVVPAGEQTVVQVVPPWSPPSQPVSARTSTPTSSRGAIYAARFARPASARGTPMSPLSPRPPSAAKSTLPSSPVSRLPLKKLGI